MTLDAMLTPAEPESAMTVSPSKPRRHRHRHVWGPTRGHERLVVLGAAHNWDGMGAICVQCGAPRDPAASRRGRTSRNRGNRTSRDLAAYLGGRNVEALQVAWDVEGPGYRIQCKRLADAPSATARSRLLDAIDERADTLRAVYHVRPRQRLAAGTVTVYLAEWVAWHGWDAPPLLSVVRGIGWLLALPLPVFRELHVGGRPDA